MNVKQNDCPVCKASQNQSLFPAGEGELVRCQNCSLVYYLPRPTLKQLSDFYNSLNYRKQFQESTMSGQSFAQARYRQLKNIINDYAPSLLTNSNRRFLDIGCGTGDLLDVAASDGWEITGTEISPLAVQQTNTTLKNNILFGDIFSLDLPKNHYDVITIYHVIEHLLSPVEILTKVKELLMPGGIVFMETPNIKSIGAKVKGKNWSHIIPPEHITYFQPSSLRYTLNQAGFKQFQVFTSSPHVIESISSWSIPLQKMAKLIYRTAPLFNMGAALQAIAFKEEKI